MSILRCNQTYVVYLSELSDSSTKQEQEVKPTKSIIESTQRIDAVCLLACLLACLLVCLLACLFACLLVCLLACLLACLFVLNLKKLKQYQKCKAACYCVGHSGTDNMKWEEINISKKSEVCWRVSLSARSVRLCLLSSDVSHPRTSLSAIRHVSGGGGGGGREG